ncbi:MAG: T9SS type A sorting domain-containing protein [Ignavibacteriales bacterium]|nr:T9SS type A sorting domain-containing protein [Ignavibacteriales bacterium]
MESTPTNIATEDYFINFDWSNGLILTKNGNHPKLVWVPNNTIQNLTGYKIYRKVDDEPFYYMGMVGTDIFIYTDSEVNLNVKESAIQYYVAATNGTQEDATNTVTAVGDYNPNKGKKEFEELSELKYFLSDNYPNPFNPNTSISYSIPENAFVTLKIYDVLGNEVEELINEQKEPGNYQIDFNASELSSGIYYYTLTAGNFTSTKKMSLIK